MNRPRSRPSAPLSFDMEALESRIVLSRIGVGKPSATVTTLAVESGTLGQPTTFNVTVRGAASAGAPQGTVKLIENGAVIGSIPLAATSSPSARLAVSNGSFTITPQPGGPATFFGKDQVTARFVPTGSFQKSAATKAYVVSPPVYTPLANGVQYETITPGTGPGIQAGQTASMMYTGYLATTGQIFDSSIKDGGTPFQFQVGVGQVVPGFDAGTLGMKVGETRIVEIPAAQGYGAQANGTIPPNSNLIFVMTLEAITPAPTATTTG